MLQQFLPPDPSGAGKQAITLARELQSLGYDPFLVADHRSEHRLPKSIEGIPVVWLEPAPPKPSRREILGHWLRLTRTLYGLRHRYDALHIHAVNFLHAVAMPVGRALRKPILVRSSLEGDLPEPTRSWSDWLHYRCLQLADLFAAISRRLEREYVDGGIPTEKVRYIPNGVDTERYHPVGASEKRRLREALGLPTNSTILTYHGVFVERKSILWALEEIEECMTDTDLVLLLVGSPGRDEERTGYHTRLRRRISESAASDSIYLTGFQKDVHLYLQASDLYLLPSTGEGLPNALLEAMSCGLIPVVSRTSGSEEVIVEGVSGFLFTPRDRKAFAAALRQAIQIARTDKGNEMSRAAIDRIAADYSIEAVAKQYGDAYDRIVRNGR